MAEVKKEMSGITGEVEGRGDQSNTLLATIRRWGTGKGIYLLGCWFIVLRVNPLELGNEVSDFIHSYGHVFKLNFIDFKPSALSFHTVVPMYASLGVKLKGPSMKGLCESGVLM